MLRSLGVEISLLISIVRTEYHIVSMTIDSQAEAFLEMLVAERGAAGNTLAAYRADLEDCEAFLGGRCTLPGADTPLLAAYMVSLKDAGMSARTQARRLSALRQFYLFLLREGRRADNPVAELAMPRLPKSLPKYLSESEVGDLLQAARDMAGLPALKVVAGLEILYSTGLRVSELLALPAQALSTDAAVLLVRGKGGKEWMIPLSGTAKAAAAELRAALAKIKRQARHLFPGRDIRRAMTRQGFALLLKQVALQAGIDPARLSPPVLRHSFASHLLAHGADLRSLQKLLGHSDISTTEIYTHVLAERLERLVRGHHPLAQ